MKSFIRYVVIASLVISLAVVSAGLAPSEARAVTTGYMWTQVKTLRSKIASIMTTNSSQATLIASLKSRLAQTEATASALSIRTDRLETSNTVIREQVDGVVNLNQQAATTLQTIETSLTGVDRRIDSLEESRTSIFGLFHNLSNAVAVLTGRMTALDASQAAMASRVAALEPSTDQGDFWPTIELSATPLVQAGWDATDLGGATGTEFNVHVSVQATDTATGLTSRIYADYVRITIGERSYLDEVPFWNSETGAPTYSPGTLPSGTPITVEYWIDRYGHKIHETRTITDWAWVIY